MASSKYPYNENNLVNFFCLSLSANWWIDVNTYGYVIFAMCGERCEKWHCETLHIQL
jgi:hypothetical protein